MSLLSRFNRKSLLTTGETVAERQIVEEARLLSFKRTVADLSRRDFVAGTALAGAAFTAAGLASCSSNGGQVVTTLPTVNAGQTPSVVDTLNFALNLEYLEASFYLYATTGTGLSISDVGPSPGIVTGGAQITFNIPEVESLAQQLATQEREHVDLLQQTITAIGGTPVSMPNLNLAALGAPASDQSFLMVARQLETIGISAYAGGAQYLVSDSQAITYAAQILDTEAQHEGLIRALCIANDVISPAVDSMDTPPTAATIFNTSSSTGLNPLRTTSQVLQIVYGKLGIRGVTSGGFFPNGLNGRIKST